MIPEQTAIRQHLSKPLRSGGACGCMGPQLIHGGSSEYGHEFTILEVGDRLPTLKAIRTTFGFSLEQTAKLVDDKKPFSSDRVGTDKINKLSADLKEAGTKISIVSNFDKGRYPECPCGMKWVEEVEGNFYKITENRSPDGITHTAKLLGPVGGPYVRN